MPKIFQALYFPKRTRLTITTIEDGITTGTGRGTGRAVITTLVITTMTATILDSRHTITTTRDTDTGLDTTEVTGEVTVEGTEQADTIETGKCTIVSNMKWKGKRTVQIIKFENGSCQHFSFL